MPKSSVGSSSLNPYDKTCATLEDLLLKYEIDTDTAEVETVIQMTSAKILRYYQGYDDDGTKHPMLTLN